MTLFSGAQAAGGGGGLMSVVITLSGTPYTYTESGGTNLGNYIGPNFTQKNIKGATSSGIPNFYVYFRQDTAGGRKEVIFGNYSSGNLASVSKPIPPANTAVNLGTYTVQIFTGGVLETGGFIGPTAVASSPAWSAGTITAAEHWFASEWRWQSALRPILNTPSTIMSNGWMLNMGTSGISASFRSWDNSVNAYASPMDAAGIRKSMHDTGGRSDIGLIPEWDAQWIISPSGTLPAATEYAMRSCGDAAHTIPQCCRDDATNAPIDYTVYPNTNNTTGGAQGTPNLVNPADLSPSSGWSIAADHFPANSYIPFMATGDRYYLEGVIFEIIGALLDVRSIDSGVVFADLEQDRSWAWGYRSIGMAYIALKLAESWGTLPSDLPPSSNWGASVTTGTNFFYNNYVNNPSNNYSAQFGSGPLLAGQETWETDFEVPNYYWLKKAAAAFSVTVTNLAAVATYKAQATIDRTSGLTAWPQAFPVPYAWNWIQGGHFTGQYWIPPGGIAQMYYAPDWATAWKYFWQGQTAEYFGYIDVPNSQLVITSLNTGSRGYNSIGNDASDAGSSWKLDTNQFLPSQPLAAFDVLSQASGTPRGVGVYNIRCDQIFYGSNSWDVPTQSPCNVAAPSGSVDPGMPVNCKFRFITGGSLPAPLSTSTDYYVTSVNSGAMTFQFSDTLGGTPINVTGSRSSGIFIMPYIGTSGSPVAMSQGNSGNSICMQTVNALAIDPTNGGYFAQNPQGGGDTDYLIDTQAALAAASNAGQSGASAAFANANTMSSHLGACMYYRFAFTP